MEALLTWKRCCHGRLLTWEHCCHGSIVDVKTLLSWKRCWHENAVVMESFLTWKRCCHGSVVDTKTLLTRKRCWHENAVDTKTLLTWKRCCHENVVVMKTLLAWKILLTPGEICQLAQPLLSRAASAQREILDVFRKPACACHRKIWSTSAQSTRPACDSIRNWTTSSRRKGTSNATRPAAWGTTIQVASSSTTARWVPRSAFQVRTKLLSLREKSRYHTLAKLQCCRCCLLLCFLNFVMWKALSSVGCSGGFIPGMQQSLLPFKTASLSILNVVLPVCACTLFPPFPPSAITTHCTANITTHCTANFAVLLAVVLFCQRVSQTRLRTRLANTPKFFSCFFSLKVACGNQARSPENLQKTVDQSQETRRNAIRKWNFEMKCFSCYLCQSALAMLSSAIKATKGWKRRFHISCTKRLMVLERAAAFMHVSTTGSSRLLIATIGPAQIKKS